MENADYFEVYVSGLTREQEDEVSAYLFEIGALGVSEKLDFEQPDVRFNPTLKAGKSLHLVAYFDLTKNPLQIMEPLKATFPEASVTVIREKAKDWLEEWKKGYEPFPLSGDIWVVPSWCQVPEAARQPLFIDPGMAFGTGTHETTQICSELIIHRWQTSPFESAFDIGTGTGILAILMSKLGVRRIGQSDIDMECKRVSQENLELNGVSNVQWFADLTEGARSNSYDLIVANIIDGVLLELQPEILQHSSDTTDVIVSGVLLEREKEFLQQWQSQQKSSSPMKVRERLAKKEWVGFWFSH